jgi:Ca-activated chloride channel family protein
MKGIVYLLVGVLLLVPCVSGCQQQSGTPLKLKPQAKTAVQPKAETKPWPYVGDKTEKEEIAEKLLAKNFVVIFDGSGSMAERKCAEGRRKYDVAREAFLEWAESVPVDANVGLVSFHNAGWSTIPLGTFDRDRFVKVINNITPGDKTPLTKAVMKAHDMLAPQARRQLGYGEYNIVVVTDGIANSPPRLYQAVNTILERTPIIIYTIGFCMGKKHSLNQPGRTYYRTANDPASLRKGLREVLAEAETFDVTDFGK